MVSTVSIVNYGVGNWGSVANMLRRVGFSATVVSTAEEVEKADILVLPGIGAFDTGMSKLAEHGLVDALKYAALKKGTPTLGICLGAQLMTQSSEEGSLEGLSFFQGQTKRFHLDHLPGRWPLPNIGWRNVQGQNGTRLLEGIEGDAKFYFVHSFYLSPQKSEEASLVSHYGEPFVCGLQRDNISCVQFHPEKSHRFGFRLLENFMTTVAKCKKE